MIETWYEFVTAWACKQHKECWADTHLSLADLQREAARCATTCHCWRHTIIGYVMGTSVGS